ncbi:MFS transporter [Streptomyces sp. XM4011]|uniref:MFS transporter n=1 Tax=Streptomyces sp. XM4011 TaxID=2929780 RepID=UPI0027E56277|nr:MFS transporter [Streptomyces sp. XM4011]
MTETSKPADPGPTVSVSAPLRRHRPFLLLATEQAAGSVGRQVTALALPLLAITELNAGPLGAATLMALTYVPGIVLSPYIGVAVDRARLRRMLALLTGVQVLVLGSVPLAFAWSALTWTHLFTVACVSGALTATVSVALQSALPRVVSREQLMAANSVLTGARTAGMIGGPALGGALIGITDPASALLVECVAYTLGVLLFLALPAALNAPAATGVTEGSRREALREGLAVLRREPLLHRQALAAAGLNLGGGAAGALFILYATQELALPPWQLGTVYTAYSVAMGAGVLVATPLTKALGLGRTTQWCAAGAAGALFLIPAASLGLAFPVLLFYEILFGLLATVWIIAMTTARQLVTPTHLLGRVNAFLQAVLTSTLPVGALVGGALAVWTGIVPVLIGAAVVASAGAASLWFPGTDNPVVIPDTRTAPPDCADAGRGS